jgi:hypothetical protein
MKRKVYQIARDGHLVGKRNAWNSALRFIEADIRDLARADKVNREYRRLLVERDSEFTRGFVTWKGDRDGKTYHYEIKKEEERENPVSKSHKRAAWKKLEAHAEKLEHAFHRNLVRQFGSEAKWVKHSGGIYSGYDEKTVLAWKRWQRALRLALIAGSRSVFGEAMRFPKINPPRKRKSFMQALLFERPYWSHTEVSAYLHRHFKGRYAKLPAHTTERYIRIRLSEPSNYGRLRIKNLGKPGKHIKVIFGFK